MTASDSELPKLLDDDNDNEIEVPQNLLVSTAEVSSDEDDVPLANVANSSSGNNIKLPVEYTGGRSMMPLWLTTCSKELLLNQLFFKDEIWNTIVENTNLNSVQKSVTSVNTNKDEISSFIGIHILMGIVQLPNYNSHWSRELWFPPVADVMAINRYEKLRQYLHSIDNNAPNNDNDKLFKVRPIITATRNECIKVEPEEFQAVDQQIIPCKTKRSKI